MVSSAVKRILKFTHIDWNMAEQNRIDEQWCEHETDILITQCFVKFVSAQFDRRRFDSPFLMDSMRFNPIDRNALSTNFFFDFFSILNDPIKRHQNNTHSLYTSYTRELVLNFILSISGFVFFSYFSFYLFRLFITQQ